MMKVLDLFCCAGGSAQGAINIGCKVTGIDKRRPSYYPGRFQLLDIQDLEPEYLKQFDFVMASPPCQEHSRMTYNARMNGKKYDDFIELTRQLIVSSGKPGFIENVPAAPIKNDLTLCGSMFGLPIIRHRKFELINWFTPFVTHSCVDLQKSGKFITVVGNMYRKDEGIKALGLSQQQRTRWEISQAIPPAYSEYILNRYLNRLTAQKIKDSMLNLTRYNKRFTMKDISGGNYQPVAS